MTAECPVCEANVAVGADAVAGELVECQDCGTELEVISLKPLTLNEAPTAQEDWGQ